MRFNQGNKQVTNIMGPKGRGQELMLFEGMRVSTRQSSELCRKEGKKNSPSGLPCLDCLASEAGRKTTPSGQNCR